MSRIQYPTPPASAGPERMRAWTIRVLATMETAQAWQAASRVADISFAESIRAAWRALPEPDKGYDALFDPKDFAGVVRSFYVGHASPSAVIKAAVRGDLELHEQGEHLTANYWVVSNPHDAAPAKYVVVHNHPDYGYAYRKRFSIQTGPTRFKSAREAAKAAKRIW